MEQTEFEKCKNDIAYFIEKYLGIELTSWQKLYLKMWKNEKIMFIFGGRYTRRMMTEEIIRKHNNMFK